jgi:two-component system, OmpR family, phosphate regulon sensor histidine kinase PhoR
VAIEALKNFNALQDPQRTREYLDISSNELQRLSLLVDKVLKLSMFEKKEIELRIETLDLTTLAEEVEASMRLQLEKQHAQLTLTHSGDTTLQGDRLHLLSVIFNLVDNALKYSTGAPSIQIELTGTEKDVQLSVKDNGIGIASEYKEKIFEKFFRVPTGDTHNAKGYGLGLSYAAHVVQKHGGFISVDSQPGLGTRFTVILPRTHA